MLISRATLVKTAPRLASLAPFWRLIWDHLECPDIRPDSTIMGGEPPLALPPPRGPSMKSVAPERLRNVVLAGHANAGKTTLAEHLLVAAGAITRLGRVADGTASLDFEPEEQRRKLTLSLAVHSFDHDDHRLTLIDTPGYADFVGEVVEGFAAADGALLVMDASGGVEAGTETAIALCRGCG
ncbi:MAG: GTP-binding protein, partial [Chloroflexota bacterium]